MRRAEPTERSSRPRACQAQPSIVQPDLQADVQSLKDNKALVQGTTEKGNQVTVNGKAVKVLGNGRFMHRVTLQPGDNAFAITSTDRHGGVTTVNKSIKLPGTGVSSLPAQAPCGQAVAAQAPCAQAPAGGPGA